MVHLSHRWSFACKPILCQINSMVWCDWSLCLVSVQELKILCSHLSLIRGMLTKFWMLFGSQCLNCFNSFVVLCSQFTQLNPATPHFVKSSNLFCYGFHGWTLCVWYVGNAYCIENCFLRWWNKNVSNNNESNPEGNFPCHCVYGHWTVPIWALSRLPLWIEVLYGCHMTMVKARSLSSATFNQLAMYRFIPYSSHFTFDQTLFSFSFFSNQLTTDGELFLVRLYSGWR